MYFCLTQVVHVNLCGTSYDCIDCTHRQVLHYSYNCTLYCQKLYMLPLGSLNFLPKTSVDCGTPVVDYSRCNQGQKRSANPELKPIIDCVVFNNVSDSWKAADQLPSN